MGDEPQDKLPVIPPEDRLHISDRPTVTFRGPAGEMEVVAKSDTGADRTVIDVKIAWRLGLGPIQKAVNVSDERRCVVPVIVEYQGVELAVNASISDRRGPNYSGPGEQEKETDALLGNPLLKLFGVYCGKEEE
jgi:hypothetical protein